MIVTTGGVIDAVIAALEAGSIMVGDGEQPLGSGWAGAPGASAFTPYVTLYVVDDGMVDGTLGTPHDGGQIVFQPTCVGATRQQASWMGDTVRELMLTALPSSDTHTAMLVSVDGLSGARKDDTIEPPVWIVTDHYRVHLSPS